MALRDMFSWLAPPVEVKASSEDILREIMGSANSKAGQVVTVRTALELPAILACTRVIAEGIAQVLWRVYRRLPGGAREEAFDHSLHELLGRRPNGWQTSFEFREQIAFHLVLTGNAFVYIVRGSGGEILELLPYEPGCVTVERATDMALTYLLTLDGGRQVRVPAVDMWHLRGPSWNGYTGLESTKLLREAIGLGLAAEEFGAALFSNGARPGGILTTEGLINEDKAKEIRNSWNASMSGSGNAMKTALLANGVKYQAISQTADEAQFNETRKQVWINIAAGLRVNPIMVGIPGAAGAYDNGEQMFIAHVVHTLMPWYERLDQSAAVNLLSRADQKAGYYTKLDARSLMRGTAKDRAEYLAIMRQNAVITANQWLDEEDMPRSTDPDADRLMPAANIFGPSTQPQG